MQQVHFISVTWPYYRGVIFDNICNLLTYLWSLKPRILGSTYKKWVIKHFCLVQKNHSTPVTWFNARWLISVNIFNISTHSWLPQSRISEVPTSKVGIRIFCLVKQFPFTSVTWSMIVDSSEITFAIFHHTRDLQDPGIRGHFIENGYWKSLSGTTTLFIFCYMILE